MKHFLLLICLLSVNVIFAQDHGHKHGPSKAEHEKIEKLKRSFFSEELDLNTKDSLAFWPIYDDYNKRLRKLHHQIKSKYRCKENVKLTESEYKKIIEEIIVLEKKEVNIKAEYMLKMGETIGYEKSIQLPCLEHEFRKRLLRELKERRQH